MTSGRVGSGARPGDRAVADAGLWSAAARGDQAARDELASLTRDLATRELTRQGAPSSDVADLAQDTVLSVLRTVATPGHEPPRFVRTFVKWRARGLLSDSRRRKRPDLVAEPAEVVDDGDPRVTAVSVELRAALAECQERLSDERELITLRYDRHVRNRDIAERLGLPASTVGVRLFRALRALRTCLEDKGFSGVDLEAA